MYARATDPSSSVLAEKKRAYFCLLYCWISIEKARHKVFKAMFILKYFQFSSNIPLYFEILFENGQLAKTTGVEVIEGIRVE